MRRVLLTGAAGKVARMIRPLLRNDYRLRLSDRAAIADASADEEDVPADLADFQAVRRAVAGTEAVIHLGGFSVEGPWDTIHQSNIVGCYNVFEAARLEGIKRVVFASSNHVVGFYRRDATIGVDVTLKPDSRYGVSKAFGEALGSLYAEKYGLEVLSIRIGNVDARPVDRRRLAIWISPRDLCQLIRIGLTRPGIRHEIVYGVSDNERRWWDNANAYRLGYKPQDRSEDHAGEVLASTPEPDGGTPSETYQGGPFVVSESGGDPSKA